MNMSSGEVGEITKNIYIYILLYIITYILYVHKGEFKRSQTVTPK